MHYKLSTLARVIIVINIVLSLCVIVFAGIKVQQYTETQHKIEAHIEANGGSRDAAVSALERQGEELFIGGELSAYSILIVNIGAVVLVMMFARSNGFVIGFAAAFTCVFATFIGGMLLFFVLLSGKSQRKTTRKGSMYSDHWSKFIHDKTIAK